MTKAQAPKDIKTSASLVRSLSSQESAPAIVDLEKRLIRFSFSSETPVERWTFSNEDDLPEGSSSLFDEILPSDAKYWNLERVTNGVCLMLRNHDRNQRLGKVTEVEFDGVKGYATVRLRKVAMADELLQDLADETAAGISFGYSVSKYKVIAPAVYEGEGWSRKLLKKAVLQAQEVRLLEVTDESIPADFNVGYSKAAAIDLRTIQIEGDPHWERATPGELKKGDFVGWNSSGGTSKGRIETVAASGSVQAVPTGPSMDGTTDQPAYLVTVWQEEADGWQASDVKVVKRASSLTEIASLKKSAVSSQQRKSKEKPVGKRSKTKPETQTRELMLSDYLTVDNPALSDLVAGLEATLAAIDTAAGSDSTIDPTALYQGAIDDMTDCLYTLYAVPDPDATEDATETDTPMATGMKTMEPAKPTQQETDRDIQFKAMQEELQTMKRRDLVTRRFTTLRQRAEALKSEGKLSPAYFNDKFGDIDTAIDLYTKADDSKIDALEEQLSDIAKYTLAVEFGSRLKNEPLEVPETRSEYDAELETYQKSKGKR